MAEGGGEEDEINPFSFKTYVKKKTQQQEEQDVDTDDIFAITGSTASTRKKDKQSLVVAEDDVDEESAQATKTKKKGNKENPFSFKKFLGQSGSSQKDSLSSERRNLSPQDRRLNGSTSAALSRPSYSPGASPSSSLHQGTVQHGVAPPDFASHLPDFIQNHFTEESSQQEQERRQLPDFTLPLQNSGREVNSASVFGSGREDGAVAADSTFSDEEEEGVQRSRQLSLPDFLVDSAVPGAQGGGVEDSKSPSAGVRPQGPSSRSQIPELPHLGDSAVGGSGAQSSANAIPDDSVLLQLQEENRQLKATLAQMRQKARDEEARVADLEKEITRLRKKEAEETLVMERAVQQVEENLVATTTRAVQAESQVSKLKQEVRNLQSQVKVLTAEKSALQSGDKGWADIRERTTYASQQLASAAVTAETNLRELLSGVEKLKLLGQVLSSLEKVTDIEDSPLQDCKASTKSSAV